MWISFFPNSINLKFQAIEFRVRYEFIATWTIFGGFLLFFTVFLGSQSVLSGFIESFTLCFTAISSLFIHEMGHALVMVIKKEKCVVAFKWNGAECRYISPPLNLQINDIVFIALGGPLFNLILFSLSLALGSYFKLFPNPTAHRVWLCFTAFNLLFGLTSLIPWKNSDGMKLLTWTKFKIKENQ